ncbi:MAG: ATP-binding cassette domain-containing protein [Planctomycetota bacterium]|jgi:tungstate transport system ATP-binding protein
MSERQESTVLRISDLSVQRDGREICHVPELFVQSTERIGVIGPNGSGKTTLLRVVAGFESSSSGTCQSDVMPRDCVFVHQAPRLFRGSVLSNVIYGLAARGIPRSQRRSLAVEWLHRVGLDGMLDRDASTLSGGETRRVAIVRACILQPKLLLLDEPFADLDPSGIVLVQDAIAALSDSAVLIASPTPLPESLPHRRFVLESPMRTAG